MSKTIKTRILIRNDSLSAWTSANPVLAKGEVAVVSDAHRIKAGDGITAFNDLPYVGPNAFSELYNDSNVVMDANYGTLKTTVSDLSNKVKNLIAAGGEPNTIDTVKVNGTALTPDGNKAVDITIKTGNTNGSLAVNGSDIAVKGLGSAAYTETSAYDMAGSADKVLGKSTDEKTANTVYGVKALVTENNATLDSRLTAVENSNAGKANKATTLAGYGITDAMTAKDIMTAIAKASAQVLRYKGTKALLSDLPTEGNNIGDVYFVTDKSAEYAWQGEQWEELGETLDLSRYLTGFTIAGITVNANNSTVAANQLQTALGLSEGAYKAVDAVITDGSKSSDLPTSSAVATFVEGKDYATNTTVSDLSGRVATLEAIKPTKVEASTINGNILVDGKETTVYTLPATVVDSEDILILNCGGADTNY